MEYVLCHDSGCTNLWGDNSDTYPAPAMGGVADGTDQVITVTGALMEDTTLPSGNYVDNVTVTIVY